MSDENNAGASVAEGGDAGSVAGEGGDAGAVQTPSWMNSAPDAFKRNENFAKFSEASEFYAKADELLKAEGSMLTIPGEDATPEEKDAFAQKMGRPETAEGYEFGKPADWPEGVDYNSDLEAGFREMAFNANLPADQAKGILDWYNKISLEEHNATVAATEKAINELKDKWKGDDFKVNTELAHRAFKQYGGDKEEEFFKSSMVDGVPLGSHPIFLEVFAGIAKTIGDDKTGMGREGNMGEKSEEEKARARFPATKF
jgi:hypothetical protein